MNNAYIEENKEHDHWTNDFMYYEKQSLKAIAGIVFFLTISILGVILFGYSILMRLN